MKDLEVVAFENEKKDYMDRVVSWVAQLSEEDCRRLIEQSEKSSLKDMVNHPPHYSNKIECLDIIEQQVDDPSSVYEGHIWRYLYRNKDKGSNIEDLEKAEFYLKRLIKHYKNL